AAERSRARKAGARSAPNPASQPRLEPIQGRKTFHLAKSPAPAYVKTRVRQAASGGRGRADGDGGGAAAGGDGPALGVEADDRLRGRSTRNHRSRGVCAGRVGARVSGKGEYMVSG